MEVVYDDTATAIEKLDSPGASADAVMVLHRPREHSQEVDLALGDPARYRFLEIKDRRLTKELADGQEVYQGLKIAMPAPGEQESGAAVETICVKGLLVPRRGRFSTLSKRSFEWRFAPALYQPAGSPTLETKKPSCKLGLLQFGAQERT